MIEVQCECGSKMHACQVCGGTGRVKVVDLARLIANLNAALGYGNIINTCKNNVAEEHYKQLFDATVSNAFEELETIAVNGKISKKKLEESLLVYSRYL